jgi:peptidoglycan hydrolase FlgJ
MTVAGNLGLGSVDSGLLAGKTQAPGFSAKNDAPDVKEAFSDFVGQTFFGQLIASMRKTVDKPAYFHGGRAEEVFQGQLDQMLAERISDVSREQFTEPMYELFMLSQRA